MEGESMRVLVALYPFFTDLTEYQDVSFSVNPWGGEPTPQQIEDELATGRYNALIVGTKKVNNAIANRCAIKAISRVGVGYDNIDVSHFTGKGVRVAYTPLGPTDSTAEMALSLMLSALRNISLYDRRLKKGCWERILNRSLKESTVGVVGFGRIGKKISSLLKPFGCEILLHDIDPDFGTANAMGLGFADKAKILQRCNVITFHLPLKADTCKWMSYSETAVLQPDTVVVNTSRGGIVDEDAILSFLQQNERSWYCSDVFVDEPYSGKLLEVENTLLTPHASSYTVSSRLQTEKLAIENCISLLRGERCYFELGL